jgi:serine/threonine protein phosphatase PrpC
VNQSLREIARERYAGRIIGSTVAVLIAHDAAATCLWAGDSRIYLHRSGRLQRLTRDHSKVEEMVAEGLLQPAEAEGHRLANVITRAVGAAEELDLDARTEPARIGDRFLLCSDGLTRTMSDDELAGLLTGGSARTATDRILTLCLQRRPTDNVTIGVVDVLDAADVELTIPARD